MDDYQLWNIGTEKLNILFAALSDKDRPELTELLARYRKTKEALAAVVAEVDAASVCNDCRGQCCQNGKYRISVLDTLARISAEMPTEADFSQKPLCPYGSEAGCTMEPGLRPSDCILFICSIIDQKLSPETRLLLAGLEQVLRGIILDASALTGEKMETPLLLWAEK